MADPVGSGGSDADLVRAVRSGDARSFARIYDRYAPRIWAFATSMMRSGADAEDVVQDVFVIASTRLETLRDPERLRPWLFAIARNECLGRLARRQREVLVDELHDSASVDDGLVDDGGELTALLVDAGRGLSERDRVALNLADVEELDGNDLADALGVPRSTAYTVVARARATARECVTALVVARQGRRDCDQLDEILDGWDGVLDPLYRKRISRHVKRCPTCERRRERSATPTALVSGAPLVVAPAALALPAGLRDRVMQSVSSATTSGPPGADQAASGGSSRATQPLGSAMLTDWPGGWPPPLDEAPGRATGRIVTAAVAVTVIVVVALAVALRLSGGDEEIDVAERRVPPTSAPAAGPAADAAVGPGPAAPEPDASAPPPPAAPPQDPRPRPPTPSEPPPTPPPSASEPVDDPVASPPTTPPVVRTLTVHVVAGDRPSQITSSAGSPAPLTCDVGETCTFPVAEGTTVVVTGASFSEPCVEYGTCVVVMDVDRVLSVYGPPIL